MSQLIALSRERHGAKRWQRFSSFSFAAQKHLVPLVAAEIPRAFVAMPVVFWRHEERFHLAGMLSPLPGRNFFVDAQGAWIGDYVPAAFRAYPFRMLKSREDQKRMVLCVDEDSGLISDTKGEPLFDDIGQLNPSVIEVVQFLKKVEENRLVTEQAVDALAEAGIIVHWSLRVQIGGRENTIPGIYKIDEHQLNRLDDETFLKLRACQALPIAYAQLLSAGNIALFKKLLKNQEEVTALESAPAGGESQEMDFGKLFDESGLLRFDE